MLTVHYVIPNMRGLYQKKPGYNCGHQLLEKQAFFSIGCQDREGAGGAGPEGRKAGAVVQRAGELELLL